MCLWFYKTFIDHAGLKLGLVGICCHSYRTVGLMCLGIFKNSQYVSKVAKIVASLNVKILHKQSSY